MASDNKENIVVATKDVGNSIVEDSPLLLKNALKPISASKNNATNLGKLNFLQSDNFDQHFDHIHDVQGQIQQQLYIIEHQTKQTGADVGQLVDRLKNNNSNLNKLLEQIANYSDEVITEGNATKHDISNITAILNEFNEKLDNFTCDDTSEKNINEINNKLSNLIKMINKQDNKPDLITLQLNFEKSLDKIRVIDSKFDNFTKEALKGIISEEVLTEMQNMKTLLVRTISDNTNDDLKQFFNSQNSKLLEYFDDRQAKQELLLSKETDKVLKTVAEHSSKIESRSIEQLKEILDCLRDTQSLIGNQDVAKESTARDILDRISKIDDFEKTIIIENQQKILASLQVLQSSIPTDSIVNRIVDPIVRELDSVSLDTKSQRLLEDILDLLKKQGNQYSSDQDHKIDTNVLVKQLLDSSIDSTKRNTEFQSNLNSTLKNISANIIEMKDKRILELEACLNHNKNILVISMDYNELKNQKLELEGKIKMLQEQYSQMQIEYKTKYEDLVKLTTQYEEFLQKSNSSETVAQEGINLKKVRKLHVHKMQDLQCNPIKDGSKRIVSSPISHDSNKMDKYYPKKSLPIIDSD